MSDFSERLVALRGYTPRTVVCAALGIKESTYTTYEHGKHEPNIATIKRIAEYFRVSCDYLLTGMGGDGTVSVSNNGDHSPVATQNASCAECPLARTVERQSALIERLSLALKGATPPARK